MSNEYPLFPELTEQGKQEAQRVMDSFKERIKSLLDEILGELYCDVSYYVESDHWTNYRTALMDGLRGYGHPNHTYEWKEVRKAIYENHKDEIIKDLNQDLVNENERLQKQVDQLIEERQRGF